MTEEELRASMGATVAQPGVLAEPEAPAVDPLRASMGAFVDRNQESLGRLRASAFQAAQTTPQKEAQKKYLSEVTGLPPAVVQTNEGEAKARARFEELRALSEQSPIVRERLLNPEFAKFVEPKDVEKLSTAEQIFRGFGEYVLRPIGGDAVSMVGKGASGLFAAPFDAAAWATQPLVGKLLPANPFGQVGDFFRQQGAKWKNWAETYGTAAGDYPDVARRSIAQGVASAYNSLLTMPASAALQGAQQLARAGSMLTPSIRALLPIGAQTGGAEYIDATQAGLSFPRALSYAGLQAGAEMTTEALPTGELLGMLKGSSSFLKSAGRFFAQEVVGEQIATAWQDFNNWVYLHPEKTVKDYLDERPQAALQTLIATVVAGGLQAGAVGLVRRSQQRAQDIAQTNDEIGKLQELMRIASGTQVRELDKANFAEFVQAAADSAPNAPKSVFIDGRVLVDTLAQSGITETELGELLPSVSAQLADAVATNRAVEIPIGEALASLPGTPLEKALLPDLRTREDGLSLNEAKDAQKRAQEFLAQDANRVIQAAANTAQATASQEAVYQRVRADYDATGRFTPEVREKGARLVAQFYSVMGARMGMRADQLYESMLPYRVRDQGPTEKSTLSRQLQAKTQRDFTTAEREYNTLKESAGGAILDTDLARELSPDYRADRSRAAEVHEAASAFIKQLYAAKLARPTPPGKAPYVLFTAGGTGAGKSSAMALLSEVVEGAEIVYDGAMAKLESAVQKIEQALAAGREVRMVYVYRDPVEALAGGALPRAMATGRTAPLSALYETHTGSRRVLGELMARYAGDPRVEFVAVDNSRGAGNAAVVAFDAVPQVSDNGLQEKLNETLEAEFQAGRISETIYRAFQGAPSPAGSGAGSSLRASDQQSGVGGQEVLEQAARVVTGRPLFEDIISAVGLTDAEFASTAIQWMTGLPDDMAFLPPTVYVDSEGGEVQTDGLPNTVAFLHARRLESGLPVLDIKNPEDRATLAKMVAAEALASIRVAGSSLEWYDQTVQTTLALMAVKYPEVNTDPRARTSFLLAVAITSQTMNVEDNLKFASEQYEAFRATVDSDGIGQFPEVGKGKSLEAMANNFKKVNTLLREMGPENLQRFLITPYTAKELNGFGFNIDENVDELVLGSAVLGPKIGFGFFSNLNGNFEPVTMDMWFMRTIGRLIGALPSFKPETFALQLRKFRSGLDERGDNGVFADRFDQALVERARTDDGAAIELARLVFKAHEKDFKDRRTDYDSGARAKSTIVKAADTMIKSLDKPKDIPANGTERQNLRDVVRQAVALVEQHHGARIPPAALQALIWYPEQELYKALGVKLRVTSQDYAGAAGKLLRSEGIDEDQIAAAIQSTQSGPGQVRSGASAANTGAAGGQPQALGGLGAFQGDERIRAYLERNQRLLELRAQSNAAQESGVLEQSPAAAGPRGGYDIGTMTTVLNGTADLSTFLHESGHFFLDALRRMVASGKATPEVAQMYQGALKALGVSEADWEKWHADYDATGKIPAGLRRAHEKWADTFEAYLFTGKAPSPEVRSLFRSFKEWLKRVYTSMQAFTARTGATLDPDLKAVMDRMLATDEQIAEAEQIAGMLPDLDATGEAQEKLDARSLRDLQWAINARNKMIAKLQKEAAKKRKEVEAEVRAEVEQMPIYRAEMLLRYGRLPEGNQTNAQRKAMESLAGMKMKLGLPQLKEMYGEDPAAPWRYLPLGKNGLAAAEGVHPDVLADGLGFPSGDALVRGLLAAEPIDSVVEGITDQRMLERYGDLASPEAIADAATEAVHNEARARSLATELSAQAEMLNPRRDTGQTNARGARVTVNALVEAAKTFADTVIGRTKVGHLKRTRWSHIQAERRAAAEWQRATARGATQEAVQAKQDQMLSNAAVRAAQTAQERVSKAQELFRRVTRGGAENLVERGYDPDIVNAARAILAAYGIAESKGKTAAEYLEILKRADPTTYAAVEPSLTAALFDAKPYEELTVDEFEALRDEVEALWHLARRSRQMEVDGDLLDREDVQEELKEDLEARGIPDTMPGETSAITPAEQALRTLTTFRAALTRVESWAQNMGGRFTKYVFQPVKEAADRYRAARTDHLKRYRALLDTVAPTMRRQIIEAPELGYTFGKDTGGVAMGEILHAILHTGNSSNKRKLLLGRGWASENQDGTLDTTRWDGFVTRLINEGVLTKAHFDFAQGVWDLLESMKPLAQKTHRDVFGRYFAEVTAEPINTPFGVYKGGYVPAIADTRIVPDADVRKLAEAENESLAFAFPATNRGFTKARVDYNRPLLLDLRLLAQHMDKVLLFSHLEQPVRDARRVLTSNTVSYGLNRIDPTAIGNVLTPWLNRAARQQVETPVPGDAGLMRLFSAARNRAGMAAMFANVANAAQQLTGFSIAAVRVRPTHLLSAAAEMMAHPKRTKEAVANASVYMKERMENETSNAEMAIKEILLDPSVYDRAKAWTSRHAYFLQQAVDNSMGPIIWTGAYNQAIEDGQSQKDAVRFADSVIRTTQGSTLPEDVSRIETGNAFVRMFTQFAGYFNMQANLLGTEFAEAARELGVKKGAGRMLYVAMLGFLAPAWVAEAIMQAFRGGPDDEDKDGEYLDDWLAAVLGWAPVRNATAMIPGVGQVINSAVNAANSKPYDDRIASSPAISMIESAVRSPVSIYKAIVEEGSAQKAVRDVATLISMGTGLPASTLARPLGYAAGMAAGDIEPTSAADAGRGLLTGVASPESR